MTRARFTISVSETTGYREVAQRAAIFERIAPRCHVNGDARWQRALRIIRAGGVNAVHAGAVRTLKAYDNQSPGSAAQPRPPGLPWATLSHEL